MGPDHLRHGNHTRLTRRFGAPRPVVCLDIPDDYGFMDAGLVRLLEARVLGRLGV